MKPTELPEDARIYPPSAEFGGPSVHSREAAILRDSLWSTWGAGRQTTDWPSAHHLEEAAEAIREQAVRGAAAEFEDRFSECDQCERPTLDDDLETIWCREPESGEQVDARICAVCRAEAAREQAVEEERERWKKLVEDVAVGFIATADSMEPGPGAAPCLTTSRSRRLAERRGSMSPIATGGSCPRHLTGGEPSSGFFPSPNQTSSPLPRR